jgi:hypothetical protein
MTRIIEKKNNTASSSIRNQNRNYYCIVLHCIVLLQATCNIGYDLNIIIERRNVTMEHTCNKQEERKVETFSRQKRGRRKYFNL